MKRIFAFMLLALLAVCVPTQASQFKVTSVLGNAGGTITPPGEQIVAQGQSITFTITPDDCHIIDKVEVDGDPVGAVTTYTFVDVNDDHTITVYFAVKTYTITASAGSNGTITPVDVSIYNCGATQNYTIAADANYVIEELLVDNAPVPAAVELPNYTYTFTNIKQNHTIDVTFKEAVEPPDTFTITASHIPADGSYGTINPVGDVQVVAGDSKLFNFTPRADYVVVELKIDGVPTTYPDSTKAPKDYTFSNVNANHTIEVTFVLGSSVQNNVDMPSLKVFPNPASNYVNVTGAINITKVDAVDEMGNVVLTTNYSDVINISKLVKGTYFLRFYVSAQNYKDGSYVVRQIVKH